jgi:hypothetical protein
MTHVRVFTTIIIREITLRVLVSVGDCLKSKATGTT